MDGWMGGWMEAKAGLRIAYSNQLDYLLQKNLGEWVGGWMGGWMDGWMDGSQSRVKDCLQQSKTRPVQTGFKIAVRAVVPKK